ncbi:PepSY-like domain-containing protein [Candidatus Sumerlaeota bacterium]|nr:PepSY-like domain-containing protein [Candidatus Sumerlaeota bacterium]
MKKLPLLTALAAALFAVSIAFVAQADEKDDHEESDAITEASLPAAVQATLKAHAAGATFKKASLDNEDGVKAYEVDMKGADGQSFEFVINADGQLVEMEENVKEGSIPSSISQGLKDLTPTGKTEELVRKTLVVYEVEREVGNKTYELTFDANGTILKIKCENEGDDD